MHNWWHMDDAQPILAALKRYWGYDSFRQKQEAIIRDILAACDVCVVMPTGGGKSLCYQLPAVLQPGKTAIVVSPLIALMQDQVAQLANMGIAAAVLNSTLDWSAQRRNESAAEAGKLALLYVSPERLARPEFLAWLESVPLSFFAIDEAHCISEWGHEFRPDYRQLKQLRRKFPGVPIAAFTASATQHVRHDIIEQLSLREPGKYIASFHRRNLNYLVEQCDTRTQTARLLAVLRKHRGESVIVYSPTKSKVAEIVELLAENEISAVGYHAGMEAAERRENQERWMSDEVNVLVGTVAFGLGINKGPVRAVIHLSLPKSIEQFYQEAGRAGRDGEPSDCVLLWKKSDSALHAHFIKQIGDEAERERSWRRYHAIRDFVDATECRHKRICAHFGERVAWQTCGACDICVPQRTATLSAAPAAASTRRALPAPGGKARGKHAKGKRAAATVPAGVNQGLLAALKRWRLERSRRDEVPAFVVLHDSTLQQVCAARPKSLDALWQIPGIGEHKLHLYGEEILAIVDSN